MMDGGTCTTSPLLRSITELSKQQSTVYPIFFSLPGHWKATRYYLLLPKLHYYRTLYCYLKWLDSTEFLIWQSIGARNLVPQASDQQQSCNCDDAPVTFRPKPECWVEIFKNRDPTWFHMGNWSNAFWGLLDHRKFKRSGHVQERHGSPGTRPLI